MCFCPTTEADLADGIGPSVALREAGARLTLGSDGHTVIDMFAEARAVELHERLVSGRRGAWSADELWEAATSTGLTSLGFKGGGAIELGDVSPDRRVRRTAVVGHGRRRRAARRPRPRRRRARPRDGDRRVLESRMTSLLVTNIGELVSWDDERPVLRDAALVVERGTRLLARRTHRGT